MEDERKLQTQLTQSQSAMQNIATACVTGALSSLITPGSAVAGCIGGAIIQASIESLRSSEAK